MQTNLTKTQKESGNFHKEIWELDLFQEYEVDDYNTIKRVPGGWIYEKISQYPNQGSLISIVNTVFIPYTQEFKPLNPC